MNILLTVLKVKGVFLEVWMHSSHDELLNRTVWACMMHGYIQMNSNNEVSSAQQPLQYDALTNSTFILMWIWGCCPQLSIDTAHNPSLRPVFITSKHEKHPLLGYKNPVLTSLETRYFSATETSRLMLCKIWDFHGGGYEEWRLLGYKNSVHTSQQTHYLSRMVSSGLLRRVTPRRHHSS
jgi:hypothetical protein